MLHDPLARVLARLAAMVARVVAGPTPTSPRALPALLLAMLVVLVASRLRHQLAHLDLAPLPLPLAVGTLSADQAWRAYEQLLRRQRRRPDTIDLYDGVLHGLWRWLDRHHGADWHQITPELADQWLAPRRGWTANTYGKIAKRFTRRASTRAWLDGPDPLEDWIPPPPPPRRRRALPVDTLRLLVQTVDPRIRMMVLLGYHQGLRVGEICRLRVDDVVLGPEPQMFVQGKGGRDAWVDVAAGLVGPLRAWLATQPRHGPLIPNYERPDDNLDEGYGAQLLARAMRPLVGETGHALRHTHAREMRRLTKDPYIVRDTMRHSSLAMQDVYVDADHELLAAALADLPGLLVEEERA